MNKQLATMLVDVVASTIVILATRYLSSSPADLDLVKTLVALYQPVVIAVIAGGFYHDKAKMEAETKQNIAAMTIK